MTSKFDIQLEKLLSSDNEESSDEDIVVADLTPVIFDEKESNITFNENNKDLSDDYKFTRSNMYGLITRSNAAIELALRVAQMSEHPRAIEALATLIKTSGDISKDLISLQKQIFNDKDDDNNKNINNTQINNYYEKDSKKINNELDKLPDE